jgi:TetR/AcrR family transcriptional regulator
MSEKPGNTEESILKAAERVFVMHGYDGTRMQMIADEAGINKALLHYYFRNKEKLFASVFELTFSKIFIPLFGMIISEKPFLETIEEFVGSYIENIMSHPFLPLFIMHELQRNPDSLVAMITMITGSGIDMEILMGRIEKEQEAGGIKKTDPRQLIVNLISLCVFPFVARPLLQGVVFGNDKVSYDLFLEERKTEVVRFILGAIKK